MSPPRADGATIAKSALTRRSLNLDCGVTFDLPHVFRVSAKPSESMRKKFAKPSEVLPDRIGAGKDSGEFLTVWMLQ